MNSAEKMMHLLGKISDDMLEEALETRHIHRNRRQRIFFRIVIAACVFVLFMIYVPAGQVLAEKLKIKIESLLEDVFPPKEITVHPEGEPETITHEIYSNLSNQESLEKEKQLGFVIYYDSDDFETMEEDGCYIIRQKRIIYTKEDARDSILALLEGLSEEEAENKIRERMEEGQRFYDSLPAREIRIAQTNAIRVEEAANKARQEFCEQYPIVSEIADSDVLEGLYFYAQDGTEAESEVKEVYFVNDGQGGVFMITAKYDVESMEGCGARFHAMIGTFEVYAAD